MKGRVRTKQLCPACKAEGRPDKDSNFRNVLHPLTKDQIDLMCPRHMTRPTRFYLDGRGIRDRHGTVGRLTRDPRGGPPFDSFLATHRMLEAIRREIDEHRFDSRRYSPERAKEMFLSKICDPWLEYLERNRSRDYADHQRRFLFNHIIPTLGDVDVRDLRGLDIQKLHGQLEKRETEYRGKKRPLAGNTVRNLLTCLRTLLNWLVKQDVLLKAPAFPPLAPIPREKVNWIDEEEQAFGLGRVRADVLDLIETMMAVGARVGEAVAWKVKDLRDGGIRTERALTRRREEKKTKTGAVSWRELPPDLYARLKEKTRDRLPEAWLFVNAAGKPYPPNQIAWLWRQAVKGTKVERACVSVASRHSRVSQLREELEKRIPDELRRQLAHTSPTTTMKQYVRDEREKA